MKIVEFEITKAELCELVEEWWRNKYGDPIRVDLESFDADQLTTLSFRAVGE